MIYFFCCTLTKTLNAHRVVKISHLPVCCKIIIYKCAFPFEKINLYSQCMFDLCYSEADDSSLMQLCHKESISAVLHNFCCRDGSPALDLVCLFVCVYKSMWTHHLMHIHTNICLGCSTVFRLSFTDKSMNLNSLAAVSPCVMQQCFTVIAAFSFRSSIWPDEKCKQTGRLRNSV